MPELQLNNQLLSYIVEPAPRNKHVYLRVRDGQLVIRANPRVSSKEIESVIKKKWDWIHTALARSQAMLDKPMLKIGSDCYFLGQKYPLILRNSDEQSAYFSEGEGMIVSGKHLSYEAVVALLSGFYKMHTQHLCQQFLAQWVERMQLMPQRISYRNNVSRWGSCSGRNNISFNSNLAQLDKSMIEYVVVHELAHIKEKNHSPRFWAIVEKHLPNYNATRKTLRQLEKHIKIYR